MPKEKQTIMGKAARYAEYKWLEEEKLFAGVKKLVSFDFESHKIKREVCHFSLFHKLFLPYSRLVAFDDEYDCVMIHANGHYDRTYK